jgi:hypothetical protein
LITQLFIMSGSILGLRDEDQVELLQLSGDHNLRVSVLGQHVRTSAERSEALSRMIWCTYRANIAAFGPTGIRSDAGWGCMHACGSNGACQRVGATLWRFVAATRFGVV